MSRGGLWRRVRSWRFATWVLVAFNAVMLLVFLGMLRANEGCESECHPLLSALPMLWVVADLVLLVNWVSGWPRACPRCGLRARGVARYQACTMCGYDLGATIPCPYCDGYNRRHAGRCSLCGRALPFAY